MMLPTLKKIETTEQRIAVVNAAKADDDNMDFPTHVVMKGSEVVGGWSLAAVPLVMGWSHSEKMKARDSLIVKGQISAVMNDRNSPVYFIACNSHSPYISHMEKFGYTPVWPTNLFYEKF